ncbi:membrane protein [Paenibacillus sp. 32O-W]|jgi:Predicted permeases|uniref:Probable membrane transporter protein n=1 Tax=Paenibacillus cisolokensis TaxID=1658519 RepID=A0ABQ4N1Z8_9BACL|nr:MULTISPECIES: TSUP family transporter [Paenibacillus]ALS26298.1 membrane protein [Paenibacillus sp. 32O-W]GIQ62202.1 UPF0721 transmembrane protein [Paenibacillus cisolokensis]
MEIPSLEIMLLLAAVGFAAAFVDSVVGGGGLLTVPALLMTGLPPSMALGTNKFAGTLCSFTSTAAFLASGKIDIRPVLALFPLSFAGSVLGTYTVHLIPSAFMRPLVVGMLAVILIYTVLKKSWSGAGRVVRLSPMRRTLVGAGAFVIGFYDGFFGPGTGSFLLFMFLLIGYDFVAASGNAKVLNFASNIASLATFLLFGTVHFGYGLPLGLAMIAGAYVGSRFAIRRGASYVRPLFIAVTALLVGKQLWDLL